MEPVYFWEELCRVLGLLFSVLYAYQLLYLLIGLVHRRGREAVAPGKPGRYAVLIAARNEEGVIGELIGSLKGQRYPRELLDVYVVADNCTDDTAGAARRAGAQVFRRFDRARVGKGYALDCLLKHIAQTAPTGYDGYFVLDADNLVHPDFVSEMDRTFRSGDYAAVTCYRNSKNFGQNWITAGYSIWFLREARFLNGPRQALGLTCHVSGTGFLLSAGVVEEAGGWPFHLLTEDIQFSAWCAAEGKRIGYCGRAVVYDEQPTSFHQAWDQRLRWSKGFFQVCARYAPALCRGMLRPGRRGFGCYDILMLVAPGALLTLAGGGLELAVLAGCLLPVGGWTAKLMLAALAEALGRNFLTYYGGMLLCGALTVCCEWERIPAPDWQKVAYLPLFPLFMLTYLPITVCALFQKVEWTPIVHRPMARLDRAA